MGFEDVMMKRLADCHAEACEEVLKSVKSGRSLGDAVLDAIESLPKSKTRDLRRWVEDWAPWEAWQDFAAKGWRVGKRGPQIRVTAPWSGPEKIGRAEYRELMRLRGSVTNELKAFDQQRQIQRYIDSAFRKDGPNEEVVAAGGGVRRVTFDRVAGGSIFQQNMNDKVVGLFNVRAEL